jgi:hypothetical protein
MKTFYVSLVKDLLGAYLEFEADSQEAVRRYLGHNYMTKNGEWKLPWCAVYDERPDNKYGEPIIIKAKCGPVFEADYRQFS